MYTKEVQELTLAEYESGRSTREICENIRFREAVCISL